MARPRWGLDLDRGLPTAAAAAGALSFALVCILQWQPVAFAFAASAASSEQQQQLPCVSQGTEPSCEQSLAAAELATCLEAQAYLPDCAHCLCSADDNVFPDIETACTMECLVEYLQLLSGNDRYVYAWEPGDQQLDGWPPVALCTQHTCYGVSV
jgi:hypothetical protein